MKRKIFMMVLFLSVALLFVCNSWGDDIEYECCCEVECCYLYNTYTDPFTLVETCGTQFKKCVPYEVLLEELCEGGFQAQLTCIDNRLENMDIVKKVRPDILFFEYNRYIGSCVLESNASCSSESLLGGDEPELDILRQFRDEVLSKSESGKKLIDTYYNHGDVLIKAFEENPGIEAFATELLEKTIERLYTALENGEELLTDEIAADIEILADELDAVVKSPGLKSALKQIKGDMKKGKVF